jgi:hypothetical protein
MMTDQATDNSAPHALGKSALSGTHLSSALATIRNAVAPELPMELPEVLDRAAVLAALSLLTANVPGPSVGQAAPSLVRLGCLNNGELAVAIHASGVSARANALTLAEIKALAIAGIARLGVAEVRRVSEEVRTANAAYCDKSRNDATADVRAEEATVLRVWGSRRREQRAIDLACRLLTAIARGELAE